jgi:hypothetical protein
MTMEMKSPPMEKLHNLDGFKNKLTDEFIQVFSEMLDTYSLEIGEVDISMAIRNSEAIANEILSDDMLTIRNKVAFAFISSVTQSANRMRMMVRKMSDSAFKQELGPIMTVLGQAGMQNLHTPSHYASAFPGMSLIGKMMMIGMKMRRQYESSVIIDEKVAEDEMNIITIRTEVIWSVEEEDTSAIADLHIKRFPETIMFPGFGGIFMEESLQKFHMDWYENFYTNVITTASYDRRWYSLVAADMHPFYKMILNEHEADKTKWHMKVEEVSNTKLTLEMLWELLNLVVNYCFKRSVNMGDMPRSTYQDLISRRS